MRNSQDDEDTLSCSICGMFRIDDSIPMITCDNSKCDLLFHVGCLKQWWSMFADSKTYMSIELGAKCPMCKEVRFLLLLHFCFNASFIFQKLSASFDQLFIGKENVFNAKKDS